MKDAPFEARATGQVAAEDYSYATYDGVIDRIAQQVRPAHIVDLGAGSGKYGRRLRALLPDATLTAVEVDRDSIDRHGLHALYDHVIELDAGRLLTELPGLAADLVILGDVIEHLPKSTGIDLLNWLHYRAGYIVVVTPEHMAMSLTPWYTGHNSLWSARDFAWHDNWATHRLLAMQLFVLRGLRPSDTTLARVAAHVNAQALKVWEGPNSVTCALHLHQSWGSTTADNGNTYCWRPE